MSALSSGVLGAIPLAVLLASGCQQPQAVAAASGPEGFLKASMDHYQGLKAYTAAWDWTLTHDQSKTLQHRDLEYTSPNLFKYQMTMQMPKQSGVQWTVSTVSNGSQMLETSSRAKDSAVLYSAPMTIADAERTSQVMGRLNLGLSPIFSFFGGSSNYGQLVDESKGAPTFGTEETAGGEPARHVLFYAAGPVYGHTDLLIGEKTSHVYKISYDLDPAVSKMPRLKGVTVAETFASSNDEPKINPADYAVNKPAGIKVVDMTNPGGPRPPAGFGEPAPDFSVTDLKTGKRVKLSSFRGKPVLLDFWATWCGPCKETLPHTEDLFREFGKNDLQVVTISDETPQKIMDFVKNNGFTFPAYEDVNDEATNLYNAHAIPLVVIIDKDGKMSKYIQGGVPEDVLRKALKKVGVG